MSLASDKPPLTAAELDAIIARLTKPKVTA